MRTIVLVIYLALFGLGSPAVPAPAQTESTSFQGRILGPGQTPVAGARVRLRHQGSSFSKATLTDGTGSFELEELPPGTYRVRVEAAGFEVYEAMQELAGTVSGHTVELPATRHATEITVTASLPEFVSELRVGSRELEDRGADDLAEALRYESGLTAIRRGPINLEPSIRGLQENQVGMFVDGTRTFAAGPARMDSDLSHVSPHVVESVRVIKGPYALTWGAGTLSAIEVDTYRPPFSGGDGFQLSGSAHLNYGENAEAGDGYLGLSGSNDKVRFHLFHNTRTGSDYEAGNGQIVPADFDSSNTRLVLGLRVGEQGLVEYSGGYQEQSGLDYPGRILDATYFYTRSSSLEYTWIGGGDVLSQVSAQLYTNRKDHRMNNDRKPTALPNPNRIPPFGIRVDLPTESNTQGGKVSVVLDRQDWRFKVGLDFYDSEQSARRQIFRRTDERLLFEDIVWPDAEIEDYGLYAQAVHGQRDVQWAATVRTDRVETATGEVSDFFLQNTAGALEQDETNLSAALNGRFQISPGWALTAGIGRSVRTATTLERYSDRFPATKFQLSAEFMGNPGLDPEESLELDLGNQVDLGAGARLSVDAFYRQIDNYITVLPDPTLPRRLPLSPPVVYRHVNGTEATFWGGELRVDQGVGRHLAWRLAANYVRGDDELLDEPVLGIPPLQGQLGLRVQSVDRRLWGDLQVTIVDDQDRVATSRFEQPTPGYTLFDLRGGLRLPRGWEFKAGIENLTDKHYSHHLNAPNPFLRQRIPEVGRNLYVGLGVRFP